MRIIKAKDYNDMSRKAANIISAQVILKPDSVLGLATGSTPIGIYNQLAEWCAKGDCDFSEVKSVNLDEYCGLDYANDQSYHYFMKHNLFNKININPANTFLPDTLAKDFEAECLRYDKLISDLGGIDMQLLGIGHNGHIGFNEPSNHFMKGTNLVAISESTIAANSRFFNSPDEVPKQAITVGIQTIMNAKTILLVASGPDKREIMQKALFGPVTPAVPASILQLHNNVIVVCDCLD